MKSNDEKNKDKTAWRDIKVLFISRKWPPAVGGMETYSYELTTELNNLVNLTVRSLPGENDGNPPSSSRLFIFFISSLFYLAFRRKEYDVIHFGDMVLFPLAYWQYLWSRKTRRVVTVHGLDLVYGKRKGLGPLVYRLFLNWARKNNHVVDFFLVNSRNTAAITRESGFCPVKAITLGVRLQDQEIVPTESGGTETDKYVLFVGRLVRRKGAAWFADKVLPLLPGTVRMYVVGKIWDREEAASMESNDRVRLFGYVSEKKMNVLRAHAAAMIMPNIRTSDNSDAEGFGVVALEAASWGIPLIASDIEGISDAVRDKETGFLVPAEDAAFWAEQVKRVMSWDNKTRQQFAENARKVVAKYYSWTKVAQDTVKVYE